MQSQRRQHSLVTQTPVASFARNPSPHLAFHRRIEEEGREVLLLDHLLQHTWHLADVAAEQAVAIIRRTAGT